MVLDHTLISSAPSVKHNYLNIPTKSHQIKCWSSSAWTQSVLLCDYFFVWAVSSKLKQTWHLPRILRMLPRRIQLPSSVKTSARRRGETEVLLTILRDELRWWAVWGVNIICMQSINKTWGVWRFVSAKSLLFMVLLLHNAAEDVISEAVIYVCTPAGSLKDDTGWTGTKFIDASHYLETIQWCLKINPCTLPAMHRRDKGDEMF